MSVSSNHPPDRLTVADLVLEQIRGFSPLNADSVALIRSIESSQTHRSGAELAGERAVAPRPWILVSGWAARVRWLPDGRRQIVNFVLPGDGLGGCIRPQASANCATVALTRVVTLDATMIARAVMSNDEAWASLRTAAQIAAGFDETYLLNQVVRLGRQTAYERVSHLLLELHERLRRVALGDENRFSMPLTQEVLADVTGLSIVHTNRILQQLRRESLFEMRNGQVRLLEPEQLAIISDYRYAFDN